MIATLTLLRHPNDAGLFPRSRIASKASPVRTPLSLPLVKDQCAHVDAVFNDADHTSDFVRCVKDAQRWDRALNSCGWLCSEHEAKLLTRRGFARSRDFAKEASDHVLLTERLALDGTVREVIGNKSKIQFIFGVKMTSDPAQAMASEPVQSLPEFGSVD